MKRSLLLKHLKDQECFLLREGKKHSVFVNSKNNRTTVVPRHREIDDFLVFKICKDVDIPLMK
jgi:predicted RNA binding protein YcfA (HicA-like mRNA interferase family)